MREAVPIKAVQHRHWQGHDLHSSVFSPMEHVDDATVSMRHREHQTLDVVSWSRG